MLVDPLCAPRSRSSSVAPPVGRMHDAMPSNRVLRRQMTPRILKRQMSLRDTLTLSPYQKWKRHRQLPLKIMLHVLVALLSATLQIMGAEDTSRTMLSARDDLSMLLFPTGCTAQWRGIPHYRSTVPTCRIRAVSELRDLFNATVQLYYNMETEAVAMLRPNMPRTGVSLQSWSPSTNSTRTYSLTNASEAAMFGPLDQSMPWCVRTPIRMATHPEDARGHLASRHLARNRFFVPVVLTGGHGWTV